MGNTWALQSGTSHFLGQNFAKAFNIQYLDEDNEQQYAWTTSWGVSTRMVGGGGMAHGDDKGLRLPPHIAPYQVVITPIWKTDEDKETVFTFADKVKALLEDAGIRLHLDARDGLSPGFKFNDWEMRGVPVRLEIGPRDGEGNSVMSARRDVPGRDGKQILPLEGLEMAIAELLENIQSSMLEAATKFRDERLHECTIYEELKNLVGDGWGLIWHCGAREWNPKGATCTVCGKPVFGKAYFSRAY